MTSQSIGFKPTTMIKNVVNISTASTILSLLALLLFGGIAWGFLAIAGATTDATMKVNNLNRSIVQLERENDQLLSDIAYAEALENVKQRALALGFVPTNPENVRYMKINNLPPIASQDAITYQFSDDINQHIEQTWYDPIIDWIAGYNN